MMISIMCCVKRDKRRTAEGTICIISERLLDRLQQLPHASVWGRAAAQ